MSSAYLSVKICEHRPSLCRNIFPLLLLALGTFVIHALLAVVTSRLIIGSFGEFVSLFLDS